jgi:predicted aspartyl protease
MKNRINILQWLIIAAIIFFLFLLPFTLYNKSFVLFIFSKLLYALPLVIFCLILSYVYLRIKVVAITFLTLIFIIISLFVYMMYTEDNDKKEEFSWGAEKDCFTANFSTENDGHIYLKATLNNVTGLFLFDTGCELTCVNEKFGMIKGMKLHPYTVIDANGIKQTKHVYKAELFELGAIKIERLHIYPSDSVSWTVPKGIHFKQDSVLGTIGNNIISKFIWDFNMENKCVTISNNKAYCDTIPDSLAIGLVAENNHKIIPVQINGEKKLLMLDFGCSMPICLSDSIPKQGKTFTKGTFWQSNSTIGALNHIDSTQKKGTAYGFAYIQLGSTKFKEIKCHENNHSDLLGIPFIWAYKRVILDFENNKAYFVNKSTSENPFGPEANSRLIFTAKTGGQKLTIEKQKNKKTFIIYGQYELSKSNGSATDLLINDSLVLPDGHKKYGPYKINME